MPRWKLREKPVRRIRQAGRQAGSSDWSRITSILIYFRLSAWLAEIQKEMRERRPAPPMPSSSSYVERLASRPIISSPFAYFKALFSLQQLIGLPSRRGALRAHAAEINKVCRAGISRGGRGLLGQRTSETTFSFGTNSRAQ